MENSKPVLVNAGLDGWLIWSEALDNYQFRLNEAVVLFDDEGSELVRGHGNGWWISPGERRPESVHWTTERQEAVGVWKLIKPELHEIDPERWPLEAIELYDSDGDEVYSRDDYRRDTETVREAHEISLADAVSPARPTPNKLVPDGDWLRRWNVLTVPKVLNRPEFAPWLPGRLSGFRAHMATQVEVSPHVTDVYCERPKSSYQPKEGPYFNVRQLWSPPKVRREKATPRSRTKTVERETWITIKVPMDDVPLSIGGVDLWDAISKWEEAEAEWLAEWSMIGARACGACGGQGWVRTS